MPENSDPFGRQDRVARQLPGPMPAMPWSVWTWLVFAPRVLSPLIVGSLFFTTHLQLVWINARENLWINVPTFLIGVLAIATSLRLIYNSWRRWTWRGVLRKRYWPTA